MKVAIVHYHLSPGGVTTVIREESRMLASSGIPHVILCGRNEPTDLPVIKIEALDYQESSNQETSDLLAKMRDEAISSLGSPPDIWHIHNPSLGKNIHFPELIRLLAESGDRLLLHLHDLAEDGRPANYALIANRPDLYPIAPNIRYAFINRHDREIFINAGLAANSADLIQNPIPDSYPIPPSGKSTLVLYPTRGIRRKNIGEFLLLAALAPIGSIFAISRAPETASAKSVHDNWRRFSEKHRLPVIFEAVDRMKPSADKSSSFADWLEAASHLATTSVAEGFGMIFHEATVFGKPLIGRNLPTNPSGKNPVLYHSIRIPSEWIDPDELHHHLTADLTESNRLYRHSSISKKSPILSADDGCFDFGNLPESIQKKIILRVLSDPTAQPQIAGVPARDWLRTSLLESTPTARITSTFSADLLSSFDSLLRSETKQPAYLDPAIILDQYRHPDRFHFLLTSLPKIRAVVFDIYGTLLAAKSGAIRPDPGFDDRLAEILNEFGYQAPNFPTSALHEEVVRQHQASSDPYPEIDLHQIWQHLLKTDDDLTDLIHAIETEWHPFSEMPGAGELVRTLSANGTTLGILSNAQANTLSALDTHLGNVSPLFDSELTILSYRHRIAKPSPVLFKLLASRLALRGIAPSSVIFVGNDPRHDILPAANVGFQTALFTGHPDSLRPGNAEPDLILNSLSDLPNLIHTL